MMATAQGPGWAATAEASSIRTLEGSAGRHYTPSEFTSRPNPLAHSLSLGPAAPSNPTSVLPAQLTSPAPPATLSAQTGRRRPISAIDAQMSSDPQGEDAERPRGLVALPAFSFNPGASFISDSDPTKFLSPPMIPNFPITRSVPPSRLARHGHRRGGSEFVGGSIRAGNPIAVMSTSPTKSESGFAVSPGLALPPNGHRHGLSGAVSANDLPFLRPLARSDMPRGSSAPNSPTSFCIQPDIPMPLDDEEPDLPGPVERFEDCKRTSDGTEDAARPSMPGMVSSDIECGSPKQARAGRARVGFSERLEFIPRPLSLISSDTSSTVTARPGHSVSGSISSVVSVASPCGRESPATWCAMTRETSESRPNTAGAVLERMTSPRSGDIAKTSPKRRNSIPTLLAIAETQATCEVVHGSASKVPKRWSIFGFEPAFMSAAAPTKPRPLSSSSSESVSKAMSGPWSSDQDSDSTETGRETPGASHRNKKTSKKKRVKGWAGSMLPLKSKGQKRQYRLGEARPPTPPASIDPLDEDDDDEDDVAGSEPLVPDCPAFNAVITEPADGHTDEGKGHVKDDVAYPMIDLDAALGPFNTPLPFNEECEAAQRVAGSAGKRRMHSGQGMRGFSGPGMHYHRRAESAPDLPPFESGRSDIHRYSSNSAMADVFEEDEDEGATEAAAEARGLTDGTATPPILVSPVATWGGRATAGRLPSETIPGKGWRPIPEADESEKVTGAVECSREGDEGRLIILRTSRETSAANESVTKNAPGPKEIAAVEGQATLQSGTGTAPASPYAMSVGSISHSFPRSPMLLEGQRISTASSSVTDKNSFQSLLMGEPGPEVRISADYDMRSLDSSNSTMTRSSGFIPSQRMSQPSLREQRPVSVSAAFGHRRSSLVSLSRLISSAHGERSKLSMEVRLENEVEGKKSKPAGSKMRQRLGRMMQFWKPSKDGASA